MAERKLITGILLLAAAIGLAARVATLASIDRAAVCSADFPAFYAGAKLLGTSDLYSAGPALAIQQRDTGCFSASSLFIRPPFFAAIVWPFAQLPFPAAFLTWRIAGTLALIACLFLWRAPRSLSLAAMAWSLPLAANLTAGQDVAFLLLWLALAEVLFRKQRPFLAGMILSLCAAKFHLFLLLPVFILVRREWRLGLGLASGGAILGAISGVLAGWDWPLQFVRTISQQTINPHPWQMQNLRGLLYQAPHAGILELLLAGLVVAIVCSIARRGTLDHAWCAMLVGGLLISHHSYLPDDAILIPAALSLAMTSRTGWLKFLAALPLIPVLYFFERVPALSFLPTLAIVSLLVGIAIAIRMEEKAPEPERQLANCPQTAG